MPQPRETYNPWTIVNVVFGHLAEQGLHPTLGDAHPGDPAAELLRALGIEPTIEGDERAQQEIGHRLAQMRNTMFEE
jgi:hypothetical protein